MSEQPETPVLRVVRGEPTAEELAALVAVLAASGSAAAAVAGARPRSEWSSRVRGMRALPAPGAGAWRASGLPR